MRLFTTAGRPVEVPCDPVRTLTVDVFVTGVGICRASMDPSRETVEVSELTTASMLTGRGRLVELGVGNYCDLTDSHDDRGVRLVDTSEVLEQAGDAQTMMTNLLSFNEPMPRPKPGVESAVLGLALEARGYLVAIADLYAAEHALILATDALPKGMTRTHYNDGHDFSNDAMGGFIDWAKEEVKKAATEEAQRREKAWRAEQQEKATANLSPSGCEAQLGWGACCCRGGR